MTRVAMLALAVHAVAALAAFMVLFTGACAPAEPVECDSTVQITRDNTSGLELCGDDLTINRVDDVTCTPAFQVNTCDPASCAPNCGCETDADCAPAGICEQGNGACACFTPCARDTDCDEDEACVCSAVTGVGESEQVLLAHPTCVPAACSTGDDCDSGSCGLALTTTCPRALALVCRDNAKDACGVVNHDPCADGEMCTATNTRGPFACEEPSPCE